MTTDPELDPDVAALLGVLDRSPIALTAGELARALQLDDGRPAARIALGVLEPLDLAWGEYLTVNGKRRMVYASKADQIAARRSKETARSGGRRRHAQARR